MRISPSQLVRIYLVENMSPQNLWHLHNSSNLHWQKPLRHYVQTWSSWLRCSCKDKIKRVFPSNLINLISRVTKNNTIIHINNKMQRLFFNFDKGNSINMFECKRYWWSGKACHKEKERKKIKSAYSSQVISIFFNFYSYTNIYIFLHFFHEGFIVTPVLSVLCHR